MKRGITLIEVLIAIVVVGVILSVILTCLNFANKYALFNANKLTAIYEAQGDMEEEKDKDYNDIDIDERTDEADNPYKLIPVHYSWECEGKTYTDTIYTRRYNY